MMVESDEETEELIYNHFSFFVDGYKYMPLYKAEVWDGQVHLYNINTKRLYFGLYDELIQWSRDKSIEIVIIELERIAKESPTDNYSLDYIQSWIDSQVITSGDDVIELRDYQEAAIIECLLNDRKVIKSPTSSGKTLIMYLISKFYFEHGKRILILTDSTNLVSQTYTDWIDYSQENKFDVSGNVQQIHAKLDSTIKYPIAISTWQSQHSKKKKEDFSYFNELFDAILIDEVHKADTKSITGILENCTKVKYRFGFSGSVKKSKVSQLQLIGLIGNIYQATTTRQLIDRGEVADIKINMLIVKYPKLVHKALKDKKYPDQINWITNLQDRNKFIVNLAADRPGNSLILFNFEEHGKYLFELTKELYPDIPVFFINGNTDVAERESIRAIIETLDKSITVGSFGTIATGWSVKRLHNLIFAHPYKSPIKIIQSIGRVLRLGKNKFKSKLFDICDVPVTSGRRDYLKKHTSARAEIYTNEELNFITHEIMLDIKI